MELGWPKQQAHEMQLHAPQHAPQIIAAHLQAAAVRRAAAARPAARRPAPQGCAVGGRRASAAAAPPPGTGRCHRPAHAGGTGRPPAPRPPCRPWPDRGGRETGAGMVGSGWQWRAMDRERVPHASHPCHLPLGTHAPGHPVWLAHTCSLAAVWMSRSCTLVSAVCSACRPSCPLPRRWPPEGGQRSREGEGSDTVPAGWAMLH